MMLKKFYLKKEKKLKSMKIRNLTKNSIKLLKLKLIKTKIYKKKFILHFFKIENMEHRLKKAFQIIYKYHINNKKILFLNSLYTKKMKSLFKKTNHTFFTQNAWFNGKMTNKNLLTDNKYSLIVILNSDFCTNILEENHKTKIPTIILQRNTKFFNTIDNYTIFGDFSFHKKKIRDNFFLSLLKVILQKAKKKV